MQAGSPHQMPPRMDFPATRIITAQSHFLREAFSAPLDKTPVRPAFHLHGGYLVALPLPQNPAGSRLLCSLLYPKAYNST